MLKSLLSAFTNTQNAHVAQDIRQLSSGNTNHNNILVICAGIAIKFEKVGPMFSSFNPCQSLPSVETDDRKQFQYPNVVLQNKPGPFLGELNRCEDMF